MRTFSKIIAVFILTLWGPATMHCDLEAAGFLEAHQTSASSCGQSAPPCVQDGCGIVENGTYRPTANALAVATPSLLACPCFLCAQLGLLKIRPEPAQPVVAISPATNWVPVWQFVRRAAPPSRAPSSIV